MSMSDKSVMLFKILFFLRSRSAVFVIVCWLNLCVVLWLNKNLLYINFIEVGPVCRLKIEPNGQGVTKHVIFNMEKPRCKAIYAPIFKQKGNSIYRQHYSFMNTSYLDCCYAPFYQHPSKDDPKVVCRKLGEKAHMNHELVKVNCRYLHESVQESYFAFVPPVSTTLKPPQRTFNVIFLGIRGVSKLNLYRHMPKTLRFIRNDLEAVEFFKYHSLGSDSIANISPLLTGMDGLKFQKRCAPDHPFGCNFIWDKYKAKGYRTIFGEDCTTNGIFGGNFFKAKPTDYFWSTLSSVSQDLTGNYKSGDCYLCLGRKMSFEVLLDYIENSATTLQKRRDAYFGVFWINSLTSSRNSTVDLNLIGAVDDDFREFFGRLARRDVFENTVVILMSEGGYMNTDLVNFDGFKFEQRMPFLFFVLPKNFNAMHPVVYKNLVDNNDKLITSFDVHETLENLVDLRSFRAQYVKGRHRTKVHSLFNDMPNRLCERVGINADCVCRYDNINPLTKFMLF